VEEFTIVFKAQVNQATDLNGFRYLPRQQFNSATVFPMCQALKLG